MRSYVDVSNIGIYPRYQSARNQGVGEQQATLHPRCYNGYNMHRARDFGATTASVAENVRRMQIFHARKRSSALFVGHHFSTVATFTGSNRKASLLSTFAPSRERAPTTGSATAASLGTRRPSRLLCITTIDQNSAHAATGTAPASPRPSAVSGLELPLQHSNPDIQLLLDRFHQVCEDGPEEALGAMNQLHNEHELKFEDVDPRSPSRAVFSNNMVDLSRIEVVGFDYDYTLAQYTPDLQVLIYDLAKRHLVEVLKYPPGLSNLCYDKEFAIMGLTVDMEKGLLCKLSYINRMSTPVLRGRTQLSRDEIKAEYGQYPVMVSTEYRKKVLKPLNDRFCLAEACLLADVMQHLQDEAGRKAFHPRAVVEDVLAAVTHVHVSGMMHERVLADIGRYIHPSHRLEHMLKTLRNAGKKLFISSNSPWKFVSAGMEHMLGNNWKELFEFVGVSASKPLFYTGNRPFRLVSKSTGRIKWSEVTSLEKGGVFTHGSIEELRRLKGWNGPSVLYFGDSLWADLVEARKLHGWTTGAIIYDVEPELRKMTTPEYRQVSHQAQALEVLLPLVQEAAELSEGGRLHMVKEDHALLDALELAKWRLKRRISDMANKNFGSIFRTNDEPTLFAFSLWRHVDLYTSRVSNLVSFGVTHRFYPTKTLSVAHEPRVDVGSIQRSLLYGDAPDSAEGDLNERSRSS